MSKIFIWTLLIVIMTITGFFLGRYTTTPEIVEKEDPCEQLPEHLGASLSQRLNTDRPLEVLQEDLISKPELIPYDPELGGKMGFYEADKIIILNEKWVYAPFEDGHIGGYMLLNYDIDNEGNIDWDIVEATLY